jgi:hypothetical protein
MSLVADARSEQRLAASGGNGPTYWRDRVFNVAYSVANRLLAMPWVSGKAQYSSGFDSLWRLACQAPGQFPGGVAPADLGHADWPAGCG